MPRGRWKPTYAGATGPIKLHEALAHLVGGLVGEGDRPGPPTAARRRSAIGIGHAMCEGPRLAPIPRPPPPATAALCEHRRASCGRSGPPAAPSGEGTPSLQWARASPARPCGPHVDVVGYPVPADTVRIGRPRRLGETLVDGLRTRPDLRSGERGAHSPLLTPTRWSRVAST